MLSSWIVKSLKLIGTSNKIHYENLELVENKNAPTHRRKDNIPEVVEMQCGMFQGHLASPLLFGIS
jgi:hypothetical protein